MFVKPILYYYLMPTLIRPNDKMILQFVVLMLTQEEHKEDPIDQLYCLKCVNSSNLHQHLKVSVYERNREKQYPEIKDQLDMLYHDLKSGNLNNGTWITAIDAVKENNPKPEGPEPIL